MANIYEDQIDPPQSRIEERLRRIEEKIDGGGDAETATQEDIDNIKDSIWPSGSDEDNTATQEDIDGIKNSIWGD